MKKLFRKLKRLYLSYRYPENVFYGRTGLKRETALNSVGIGWSKLINTLYDAKPKGVRVVTVKEKFGSLRFYVNGCPAWYDSLIDFCEAESAKTCERCGEDGKIVMHHGWYTALCSDCAKLDRREKEWYTGDSDHEHDDRIL